MVSTGLASLDGLLGGTGYPDRSAILVVGQPGSAKNAIGYHLFDSGVGRGDFCIYVTRRPASEVLRDMNALGFTRLTGDRVVIPDNVFWIAAEGGQMKYANNNVTKLSLSVKEALTKNQGRKIRIVVDVISSLLMLNPSETIYRFLDQLLTEVKRHDAVLLATLEEGMHETQVIVALEQLFDGVLEIRTTETEQRGSKKGMGEARHHRQQILWVRKMMGVALPSEPSVVLDSQIASAAASETAQEVGATESRMGKGELSEPSSHQRTLDRLRIAILPFANISPNPSDEYFADGMTEEMISTISKVSALRVIARTSVMRYKNNPQKGIDEIGHELKAGTILEGSVRKDGGRLRITVQLIDSESSEHLWSESYERKSRDVFAIQGEVSKAVADTLKVKLLAEEKRQIMKEPTKNAEAFNLYLRGQYVFRHAWTEPEFRKAIGYYERALELDSSFAMARSRLAECFASLGNGGWLAPLEAFPKAEELARKALDEDPDLPEAHNCMGYIKFNLYDWRGAISEVKKAIALNPNFSEAHSGYSGYLWVTGRLDQSVKEAKKALELDPFSPEAHFVMVQALYFSGKYELCREWAQRLISVDPASEPLGRSYLGQVALRESRFDQATTEFQRSISNGTTDYNLLFIAQAYLLMGRETEGKRLLDDFREAAKKKGYVPAGYMALMHLVAGENEEALDCLEKAVRERSMFGIAALKVSPVYDGLRNHPRFRALLENVGLGTSD